MSVSPDRKKAVVTHVYKDGQVNRIPALLRLTGLSPDADYRLEDGTVYGGDELMARGIPLSEPKGNYHAQQFFLEALE